MVKAHEFRARRVSKRVLDDRADTVRSRKIVDSRSRSRSQPDLFDVPVGQKQPIPDFSALQAALGGRAGARAAREVILYAFDLLYLDGHDLRREPLEARRRVLADLIAAPPRHPNLRLSEHLDGDGRAIWRHACAMGLEGIVSKRRDQPYRSGRSTHWLKTKCVQHGTFMVVGYLPEGTKRRVGALLVAAERDGDLVYAGKVGSGLSTEVASGLWRELEELQRPTQPCSGSPSPGTRRNARWIEPKLQAEIEYRGVTSDGKLRHPVFRTFTKVESGR